MNQYILFVLACLVAIFEWIAIFKGWRKLEYFFKPGVVALLLGWLVLQGGPTGALLWFEFGLLFSLAGDLVLMFSNERRWFVFGLGAFLLTHIAYLFGINTPPPSLGALTFGVALMIIMSVLPFTRRILLGLRQKGLGRLDLPVRVYATVLALMLFSAMMTLFRTDWYSSPAYLVSAGAVLFVASDMLLAWNKFVNPVRGVRLFLMISYQLGQILLVLGAFGQFGR